MKSSVDVIEWLLAGDPAIRWQVLRDLADSSPDVIAAERARVESAGQPSRWNTLRALRILK